jgi:hypothetical protein
MTPSSGRAPVVRKSSVLIRNGSKPREVVVTLHAEFITLRLLGTRKEETISLEHAWYQAVKARVFSERMTKAKVRKERAELNKKRTATRR